MAKYIITNKAVEDLSNIWEYTFEVWSENQADKYYEILCSAFEKITEAPEVGKSYPEIAEGIIGFRVNKHIIFYRIIKVKQVEILRILHGSMDLKNRIIEE